MANTRVFEVDLKDTLPTLAARARLGAAAEARIARRVRGELVSVLNKVIDDAFADSKGFGIKSKNAFNIMRRGGVRAFGTSLGNLRGHIIGPEYIAAQEEGAIIRPRRAKALAIPLPAALRPDGTPKLAGPRNWRGIRRTFIYKSKRNGRAYIAYKRTDGGLTLLYALVDRVEITAKRALSRAWDRNKVELIEAFGRAMVLEMGETDLLALARITYKGRGTRRGNRRT